MHRISCSPAPSTLCLLGGLCLDDHGQSSSTEQLRLNPSPSTQPCPTLFPEFFTFSLTRSPAVPPFHLHFCYHPLPKCFLPPTKTSKPSELAFASTAPPAHSPRSPEAVFYPSPAAPYAYSLHLSLWLHPLPTLSSVHGRGKYCYITTLTWLEIGTPNLEC